MRPFSASGSYRDVVINQPPSFMATQWAEPGSIQSSHPLPVQPGLSRKWPTAMKLIGLLAVCQLALAVLMFIFGINCVVAAQSTSLFSGQYCSDGSGIWNGILSFGAALLGIGAALNLFLNRQSWLKFGHTVGTAIVFIGSGILAIFSCIWLTNLGTYSFGITANTYHTLLALNVILLITAVLHMILTAMSLCTFCYMYFSRDDSGDDWSSQQINEQQIKSSPMTQYHYDYDGRDTVF